MVENKSYFQAPQYLPMNRDIQKAILLSIFFFIERKVNNYFLILQPIEVLNYLKNRYIISLDYIHYI